MAGTQIQADQDLNSGAHGIEPVNGSTPNQSSLERVHKTFCQCPLCGQKFAWHNTLCDHLLARHDFEIAGVDEFFKLSPVKDSPGFAYEITRYTYDCHDIPQDTWSRLVTRGEAHRAIMANIDCVKEART